MKYPASTEGRSRVVIENLQPEIDCGRFPIKRTLGELVSVEADVFCDGHDLPACVLVYRFETSPEWTQTVMTPLGQDRWQGSFTVNALGRYRYCVWGWVNRFLTWRRDLTKRLAAAQDVKVELQLGAELIRLAELRAPQPAAEQLRELARLLAVPDQSGREIEAALSPGLLELMSQHSERQFQTVYDRELAVVVEPARARCSAWYEFFPRSSAPAGQGHGTLKDCTERLPAIAEMGFDVLYLPPIHPIGLSYRKGKNNATEARQDDVGSPWAIGAKSGGHKAVHPQLGTVADLRQLAEEARRHNIDLALDLAFQCAPDHPYVAEHPEWFRKRPDGTIQYAENPPKKYQDIFPFDFETENWRELWEELKSIVLFWIEQGVFIFRVDNPHTKPFRFWEWLIAEVKQQFPQTLFLAEAFTRPKVMYELGKLGFSQSYTYFTWRNTKWELTQYFTELTRTPACDIFRPNAWPNTPDILPEPLQVGGRPAFEARVVLAATLSANYGIYGPAFELCESQPRESGSEEYRDSEKYEIRNWDLAKPNNLQPLLTRLNRIRRDNPALQSNADLQFHPIDNEQLLCYSKRSLDGLNTVLMVVNLDPHHTHSGWLELPLETLGLEPTKPYQVHDQLSDARYFWQGSRNFVELNPQMMPAHIFRLRRRIRSEHEFEYFL